MSPLDTDLTGRAGPVTVTVPQTALSRGSPPARTSTGRRTRSTEAPSAQVIRPTRSVRDDSSIGRRRVFVQVAIGAVVVIAAVAVVGVLAARRLAETQAVYDAAKTTDPIAESVVQPVITDGLLTGDPVALTATRFSTEAAGSGGFAAVTLGSILLLVVLLFPVLWRLLNRLNRSQIQREALLQRSIDASTEERPRIAGTLHDGVVQDLAAASFAVSGSAERAVAAGQPALAQDLRASAGVVRSRIGGLRLLLVDIYPPNLVSAGLARALEDLVVRLRSRGLAVTVSVPAAPGLDETAERLVYRVTQECLTNIARHAAASTLAVRLSTGGNCHVLDITDDGTGFDVTYTLVHPPDGHFGLRILGDLAADAGAELNVSSAPGAGTHWQLRQPNESGSTPRAGTVRRPSTHCRGRLPAEKL